MPLSFPPSDVEVEIKVNAKNSGGVGLAWDQLGTELKEVPILFEEGGGTTLHLVGPIISLSWNDFILEEFDLSIASGGAILPETSEVLWEDFEPFIASGGAIFLEYSEIFWDDYEVTVSAGTYLWLTDGSPLLLTDGTGLFLEGP